MIVEDLRLHDIARFVEFDLENDPELLEIVEQACSVTGAVYAVIALIDNNILHLKVRKGVEEKEMACDASLCAHALHDTELMMVYNTDKDKRFSGHYNVNAGRRIKSFAAMPL